MNYAFKNIPKCLFEERESRNTDIISLTASFVNLEALGIGSVSHGHIKAASSQHSPASRLYYEEFFNKM